MARKSLGYILVVCLVLGVLFQAATSAQYLITLTRNKVWANRRLDAVARSADVAFGEEFSRYIRFLDDEIPEDAIVIIPSGKEGKFYLNSGGLMQYFLFPRQIRNCGANCASLLADQRTYVLEQGEFPPPGLIPPSKAFLPFGENLGLYAPSEEEK